MPTIAALKQARYRTRQRHPLRAVYRVEIERDQLLDALVSSGRLTEADVWRRDMIEIAISEFLDEWARGVLR